ncbi:Na+/H+ antiporter subunit C [Ostreibacterium oceani]|uniref:Na+/H+ antiporter subunit C n=1 Tax=Ostreibacterium oceani TaxID=2654998 RepID=A0A6N7EUQ2_9GAMM|nr:Na+/H+ antiporter subunit C [Ostreibacterium oceani]MPV86514.1 Na+/H+ antiporter subunit C [Ostreibacterium oceani]
MEQILPFLIGGLYTAAVYMILHRSFVKLIIGLLILGYASNLLLFAIGRVTLGQPPLIADNATRLIEPFADPLPQALILTAIVIGFGIQTFAIVLIKVAYRRLKTDNIDELTTSDKLDSSDA